MKPELDDGLEPLGQPVFDPPPGLFLILAGAVLGFLSGLIAFTVFVLIPYFTLKP